MGEQMLGRGVLPKKIIVHRHAIPAAGERLMSAAAAAVSATGLIYRFAIIKGPNAAN